MLRRRPVITGVGILSAAGSSPQEVWASLRAGQVGLGPLTLFGSTRYACHQVGQVRVDLAQLAGPVRGSRSDKLAWIAARQALTQAGFGSRVEGIAPDRVGVVLGGTVGGMLASEQVLARLLREKRHRFGTLRFHECASAAELCARQIGARGPCTTLSTACSAGALAIAAAAELIEQDEADVMLAGASDSLCRLTLHGFGSLLLLDPNGCRPFDATRAGISLGEGAAVLVLEAESVARQRGAPLLAALSGWGASCDAYHATAPQPDGDGALTAMQRALGRAGLAPTAIDYVNAHGTGTPDNDAMEAAGLRRLFGERLPPFSSTKRFFGHTLAASGALKAVVCVQALQEQALPPNPGFEVVDPRIGLEPVRALRPAPLAHVLSSSFGFGGSNAALVFSHPDTLTRSSPPPRGLGFALVSPRRPGHYAVVGLGLVSAAGSSLAELGPTFQAGGAVPTSEGAGSVRAYACRSFTGDDGMTPARRRRLNRLQQMAIAAARRSMAGRQFLAERACVAMGTGLGCLEDAAAFVENLIVQDEGSPLPLRFTNSVHNALASQIALELGLKGLNSTLTHRETSFEAALWHGTQELELGHADLALVGAADETNRHLLAAGARWGWWDRTTPAIHPFSQALGGRQRALPGEGAAVFALVEAEAGVEALATVSSVHFGPWARTAAGELDAAVEAEWIRQALGREGLAPRDVDVLLTGANGWPWLDRKYDAVARTLSRLADRPIPCGAYKHGCGEHASASAFGLATAIGLVRGEIELAACLPAGSLVSQPKPRRVMLYTLSPGGGRGLCCVSA
jgi:3-oxoacyl-(acyl-carrier-protein) synthase